MSRNSPVLPDRPRAGVCMHFSSLPSPFGIGDIGDAAQSFLKQLQSMGIAVWQFLPTGPTAYGDSPYQPLSAFAGNEMLIGLEPLVRQGLLQEPELQALQELDQASVDFGHLIPLKHALLSLAAERFETKASAEMKAAYAVFLENHYELWLKNYALYRSLKTRHGEKPWPQWDTEYVHREPAALRRYEEQFRQELECLQLVQFFFYQQWRALFEAAKACHISLFGDVPIYIALDSADAWANPELLLIDSNGVPSHVAGVPPDYFSADGQLWGNPLYDWDAHARQGYTWWIARMRHAGQCAQLVRIDHFRGFESYWSVPFGETTARNGSWERGPRDGLFLALQSSLGHLGIVAENLGVITPQVEALRLRHRMPGMVVLQFEVNNPEFDPAELPANTVCYTGTHDNDTTLGWFQGGGQSSDQSSEQGSGQDTRSEKELKLTRRNALRLSGGTASSIHTDMIRLAFSTPARLAVVPMQDFLGLDSASRMNIPGTTSNNWRWRMRPEELDQASIQHITTLIAESSRA